MEGRVLPGILAATWCADITVGQDQCSRCPWSGLKLACLRVNP